MPNPIVLDCHETEVPSSPGPQNEDKKMVKQCLVLLFAILLSELDCSLALVAQERALRRTSTNTAEKRKPHKPYVSLTARGRRRANEDDDWYTLTKSSGSGKTLRSKTGGYGVSEDGITQGRPHSVHFSSEDGGALDGNKSDGDSAAGDHLRPPTLKPTPIPSPNPTKRLGRAPTPRPTYRPTTHPSPSPTQHPTTASRPIPIPTGGQDKPPTRPPTPQPTRPWPQGSNSPPPIPKAPSTSQPTSQPFGIASSPVPTRQSVPILPLLKPTPYPKSISWIPIPEAPSASPTCLECDDGPVFLAKADGDQPGDLIYVLPQLAKPNQIETAPQQRGVDKSSGHDLRGLSTVLGLFVSITSAMLLA